MLEHLADASPAQLKVGISCCVNGCRSKGSLTCDAVTTLPFV